MKKILICGLLISLWQLSPAFAEQGRRTPSLDGTYTAGPYYNPSSKSYFEMFFLENKPWHVAKNAAEEKHYKGVQGRLATVRTLETHQFITRHFKANNFWIGLQYFCKSGTLKWIDGSDATATNFSAWDTQWSNTHIRCAAKGYMPVHYTSQKTSVGSLRWRASGPAKYYHMYLVEYPTGKE